MLLLLLPVVLMQTPSVRVIRLSSRPKHHTGRGFIAAREIIMPSTWHDPDEIFAESSLEFYTWETNLLMSS